MSKVLIIYHSFTGKTRELAESAAEGARSAGAEVVLKEAVDTNVQDLAAADAIVVAMPQPFQIMDGETKKLFERLWRDREHIGQGKSLSAIICHMGDATATREALKSLAKYYILLRQETG